MIPLTKKKIIFMTKDEFIKKAILKHGNKYNYNNSIFTGLDDPIFIECPIHGQFRFERAKYHIYQGRGCQKCGLDRKNFALKDTLNDFILKSKELYGEEAFNYEESVYIDSKTKLWLTCRFGHRREQMPSSHLQGHGCKVCFDLKKPELFKLSLEEVLLRFEEVHGTLYDYSLITNYTGCFDPLPIICKVHGYFELSYTLHYLHQTGCKYCNGGSLLTTEEVIKRFKTVHGDRYDYRKYIHRNSKFPGIIICSEHGEFKQTYPDHYHAEHGCSACAGNKKLTTEKFIELCNLTRNVNYNLEKVEYNGAHINILLMCPIHGQFRQSPSNYRHNQTNCPRCSKVVSKAQKEIYKYICTLIDPSLVILEDRENYPGLQLDITIPSLNLAIEYNGVYYHAFNNPHTSRYDLLHHLNEKRLKAKELYNLRVINIYEDEWENSQSQIKQILKNALNTITTKIAARKCTIWKDDSTSIYFNTHIKSFFDNYHHQGLKYKPLGKIYCLIYKNEIVAMAYFGQTKYHTNNECELIRYVTKADIKVQGGLSKLIKNFIRDNANVNKIISYCDNRFFTGESYLKVGFKKISDGDIGSNVIIGNSGNYIRKHRSAIVKSKLLKYFPNIDIESLSKYKQIDIAFQAGMLIVPDCGHQVLLYTINRSPFAQP